jgi:hypothetical protein
MARYFFHIKDGAQLIEDEEGSDLANATVVRARALKCARELLAEAIRTGRDLMADAFLVVDEQGEQVMLVPLTEALPERLRRE